MNTRLTRNLGAAVVATIAAWSSYRHMVGVALTVGESREVAYVLPLSVDGLLLVASIAMVDDRQAGRSVRWSARVAFAVGVLASVAANVAHAQPTLGARIVSAWPALALLLTVELLSRAGRHKRTETSPTPSHQPDAVRPPTARTAGRRKNIRRPVAQTRSMIRELRADDPGMDTAALARQLRISERRVRQLLATE